MNVIEYITHDNYVYYAAKKIRASLFSHETVMPWPPCAIDLKDENISLPNSAYDFQPQNGRYEKVDLKGDSVKQFVLSFCHDLLHAVFKGR